MLKIKERLVNTVVNLASDDDKLIGRLGTVARIGKRLAPTRAHRKQLSQLQWAIDNDHPAIELIRRVVRDTNRNTLQGFVNLFVNHTWDGYRQRQRFEKEHGLFPPSFVVISPLAACNLHCVGCYAGAYGHREPNLTYEDMEKIIDEVREWGCRFITISGGEPTLYWKGIPGSNRGIYELCRQYNDMVFLMYTNGTLIDEQMASDIAELGNITPAISVEGFRTETDARRGEGVFDKVKKRPSSAPR